MLQANPDRAVTPRRPGRALIGAVVAAGVLVGAAAALPVVVAPLLDDSAHPVPAATFVRTGPAFVPMSVRIPVIPARP